MEKNLTIEIENLTFYGIIGILPFEREKKQKIVININIEYLYDKKKFIDYSEITSLIEKIIIEKKFELIEDAIVYCEETLHKLYKIKNLYIKISKPNILKNSIVSLSSKS
jgi:dihydroneopterin aldolase